MHTLFRGDAVRAECRQKLGDRMGIANSLTAFAEIAKQQKDYTRSVKLLAAECSLRELLGAKRTPAEASEHEQEVSMLRSLLSKEAFDDAWQKGCRMEMEEALDYALLGNKPRL